MDFDVIITTYNRPGKLLKLINQILQCSLRPQKLIVVDSSDERNNEASQIHGVSYYNTPHKNQPYQRYLGFQHSGSEIIIFFDDDIDIIDRGIFEKYLRPYELPDTAGVTVGIDYKNIITTLAHDNYKSIRGFKKQVLWLMWTFTGNPPLKEGEIFLAGLSGGIPLGYHGRVQYFQGANMSFRRKVLEKLFDDEVFSFYEMKIGKGEDKMLSMRANQFGTLYAVRDLCLRHPPEESHYYQNQEQFHKRTAFSRLYLSKVYCHVMGVPWWRGIVHYYWFSMWRLVFSSLRVISHPKGTFGILKGQWKGIILGTFYLFNAGSFRKHINWRQSKEEV